MASGELLVVGTDEEDELVGDIVSIHRNAFDEMWRKPSIGCVEALLSVGNKLYVGCCSLEGASVFALDAATGEQLFSTRLYSYLGPIQDLLHEGGLLFVCLRFSFRHANGFICGIEAKTGKMLWGMELANLSGGFKVCAT